MKEREIVKAGYNAIAPEYLRARAKEGEDVRLVADLVGRLPRGSRVLDAGCGAGVAVTLFLSEFFDVVGVDFAGAQLRLARARMPGVQIPVPGHDSACLRRRHLRRHLLHLRHHPRPPYGTSQGAGELPRAPEAGWTSLGVLGGGRPPASVEEFHGRPMYWSHFDGATTVAMLELRVQGSVAQDGGRCHLSRGSPPLRPGATAMIPSGRGPANPQGCSGCGNQGYPRPHYGSIACPTHHVIDCGSGGPPPQSAGRPRGFGRGGGGHRRPARCGPSIRPCRP